MQIENEFTVAQPVEPLWAYLLDVEKIAPCMPGAELTEHVDDTTWKGKVNVAFGPVKLSFAGTVELRERDDTAHRVTLAAKGMEAKGKGAATANVTSWLEPVDASSTMVHMQADITLTGAAAQLSRGLLPEISKQMTQRFADCLQDSMGAPTSPDAPGATVPDTDTAGAPAAPASPPAQHVGGIGLGLKAIWSIVAGWFRKLFGRGDAG
jgi:carbon monoxide dehydrogenase subunit G